MHKDENEEFLKWISDKLSGKKKKKGKTYRDRVLSGEQLDFRRKPRKYMRQQSKKGRKRQSKYSKAASEYLKENPFCEICGREENLSIHHKAGRNGSLLWDKRYFMTTCMIGYVLDKMFPNSNKNHTGGCHGWIEANKNLAREKGWILDITPENDESGTA